MTFSLLGSVVDVITLVLGTVGLPGLFAIMTVESFGIPPIPSEVVLPFAGFLVAEGTFSLGGAIVAALAGGLVGAFAAYAVGRGGRARLTNIGVGHLRLRPETLDRMDRWFSGRGEISVALARMVPVVRSYISYPAGTARMNPLRFGLYTLLGSTPFALALLYAGIVLRSHWLVVESYFLPLDTALLVLIVAVVAYVALVAAGVVAGGWPPRWGPRYGPTSRNSPETPSALPKDP